MAASYETIQGWFERGVQMGATHLIVVCDTYDHSDYPDFVMPDEDVHEEYNAWRTGGNMQRVMEVYKLSDDRESQMAQHRCFNF